MAEFTKNALKNAISDILVAVSYTHLDVYKRQFLDKASFDLKKDIPELAKY